MTLPPLLTFGFWFNPTPPPFLGSVDRVMLFFFAGMTIIGVVALLARLRAGLGKDLRRMLMRAGSLLITMGLFGLFLWSMLYERVPYLSMRMWYILWLVIFGIWIYRIYHYVYVEIPARQKTSEERDAINKWLPKSKK